MIQSADGSCNNMGHPTWGMMKTAQRRYLKPTYDSDGSTPGNYQRLPSARALSNLFSVDTCNDCTSGTPVSPLRGCHPDPSGASAMVWQFGQLIDHDIVLSPPSSIPDFMNIKVPYDDPCFHKHEIEMMRSNFTMDSRGMRNQMNFITSFIDASFVYGSTEADMVKLRSGTGGRLLTSIHGGKEMLPHTQPSVDSEADRVSRQRTNRMESNALLAALSKLTFKVNVSPRLAQFGGSVEVPARGSQGDQSQNHRQSLGGAGNARVNACVCAVSENKKPLHKSRFEFLAGDVRANEQLGLTSMHTLWLREHNRIADKIKKAMGSAYNDEYEDIVFQLARRRVIAEVQAITWHEWLPVLIGHHHMNNRLRKDIYQYNPHVEPSISNEFSVLYRVGHSMINDVLLRLDSSFRPSAWGDSSLREAFFQPQKLLDKGGIEPLLAGLLRQRSQKVDSQIVEDLRSFLFTEAVGSAGLDLAAFNIQRGRDHGLPSYTHLRQGFGLSPDFERAISPDNLNKLHAAYGGDMHAIDAWLGALLERPVPGALVGELLQKVIGDDFNRLRIGDRYWYEKILKDPSDFGDFGDAYWGVLMGTGLGLEPVTKVTLASVIAANTDINIDPKSNAFFSF